MVNATLKFFCSLRLTVALLTLAMFLVFFGTMAQVDLGLYQVQAKYFRSFLVLWTPHGTDWKIPVYPGGYLLGGALLINLIAAHIKRFKFTWSHFGLFSIHAGIILLLLGQLSTDLLSTESTMRLSNGQTGNYSEASDDELVVVNTTDPDHDDVLGIAARHLASNRDFSDPRIPFTINVQKYFANSSVTAATEPGKGAASQGLGTRFKAESAPLITSMERRNIPAAVIELRDGGKPLGTFLVSEWFPDMQEFQLGTNHFKIAMRPIRYYQPFSIKLLKFSHDRYIGTDIPKNFSSDIELINPQTKEDRRYRIFMNNPLRYAGLTYYQASFDPKDDKVTILQVVHNPGWVTPYAGCIMVAVGMLWQFLGHLKRFIVRQKNPTSLKSVPVAVGAKRKKNA